MRLLQRSLPVLLTSAGLLWCQASAAQDSPPSIFTYGSDGLWMGAQVGLAAGYLATGDDYESDEWRKLVFGAGVGAARPMAASLVLAQASSLARLKPPPSSAARVMPTLRVCASR